MTFFNKCDLLFIINIINIFKYKISTLRKHFNFILIKKIIKDDIQQSL